ncbi:MAG: hypothetical protein QOE27_2313 [Solirubrobacteraceae bacterium]|nr:hypothetical protein [Solirubrobacteraceae bacterium]
MTDTPPHPPDHPPAGAGHGFGRDAAGVAVLDVDDVTRS